MSFNEKLLLDQFKTFNIESEEVMDYSVKLLTEIFDLFKPSNVNLTPVSFERYIQPVLVSIIRDVLPSRSNSHSMNFYMQCIKSNALVSAAMDVLGNSTLEITLSMYQQLNLAITEYNNILEYTKKLRAMFVREPSALCNGLLSSTTKGCDSLLDSKQNNAILTKFTAPLCRGYCINVLRGCLSDSLIDTSIFTTKGVQRANKKSILDLVDNPHRIQSSLSTVRNAFDVNLFVGAIRDGMTRTRKNVDVLQAMLNIHCGHHHQTESTNHRRSSASNKPRSQTTIDKPTVSPTTTSSSDRLDRRSLDVEINRIADSIVSLTNQRAKLAREQMPMHENQLCPTLPNSVECWNGRDVGRYSQPVPAFTPSGQLTNPELALIAKSMEDHSASSTRTTEQIDRQPSTDWWQADDSDLDWLDASDSQELDNWESGDGQSTTPFPPGWFDLEEDQDYYGQSDQVSDDPNMQHPDWDPSSIDEFQLPSLDLFESDDSYLELTPPSTTPSSSRTTTPEEQTTTTTSVVIDDTTSASERRSNEEDVLVDDMASTTDKVDTSPSSQLPAKVESNSTTISSSDESSTKSVQKKKKDNCGHRPFIHSSILLSLLPILLHGF